MWLTFYLNSKYSAYIHTFIYIMNEKFMFAVRGPLFTMIFAATVDWQRSHLGLST